MIHKNTSKDYVTIAKFAIPILILLGATASVPYWTEEKVTITITEKERVTYNDGDSVTSKYLIFTEHETFENVDSLVRFKFDSSDLYGKLKDGQTYKATVYGFRVKFLSMYRNIVTVEEVSN